MTSPSSHSAAASTPNVHPSPPSSILRSNVDPFRGGNPVKLHSGRGGGGGGGGGGGFSGYRPRRLATGWDSAKSAKQQGELLSATALENGKDLTAELRSSNDDDVDKKEQDAAISPTHGRLTFATQKSPPSARSGIFHDTSSAEWTAGAIKRRVFDHTHRHYIEDAAADFLEKMLPLASKALPTIDDTVEGSAAGPVNYSADNNSNDNNALRKTLPSQRRKLMSAANVRGRDTMSRLSCEWCINGKLLAPFAIMNLETLLVRAFSSIDQNSHLRVIVIVHLQMSPARIAVLLHRGLGTSFGGDNDNNNNNALTSSSSRMLGSDASTSVALFGEASMMMSQGSSILLAPQQQQQQQQQQETGGDEQDAKSAENEERRRRAKKARLFGPPPEESGVYSKISALAISFCYLEDQSAELLFENLTFNSGSSITSLDISHNQLTHATLPLALRCVLQPSSKLRHLNLRGNSKLFSAARESVLSATAGTMAPVGAARFLDIASESALHSIDLSLTGISSEDMGLIIANIGSLHFRSLAFDGADLSSTKTAASLLEQLKSHNTALTHLSLRFCSAANSSSYQSQLELILGRNLELLYEREVVTPLREEYGADAAPPRLAVQQAAQRVYRGLQPMFATGTPDTLTRRIAASSLAKALGDGELLEPAFAMRETTAGLKSVMRNTTTAAVGRSLSGGGGGGGALVASVLGESARRERQLNRDVNETESTSPSQRIAQLLEKNEYNEDGADDSRHLLEQIDVEVDRLLYINSALPPGFREFSSNRPSEQFLLVSDLISQRVAEQANNNNSSAVAEQEALDAALRMREQLIRTAGAQQQQQQQQQDDGTASTTSTSFSTASWSSGGV